MINTIIKENFNTTTTNKGYNKRLHLYTWGFMQYTVYREIFVSILFLPLSPSLSVVNLIMTGRIQIIFLITVLITKNIYNILCIGYNLRQDKTICNCRRAKITRAENNPVYSVIHFDPNRKNSNIF